MIKSLTTLYLSDFDGTICGEDKWSGYFKNTISCFSKGPYINYSQFDIRWSILTGRPRIDFLIIKLVCAYYGFLPEFIFTSPHVKYNYNTLEENYLDKLKTIKNILDGKIIKNRIINKIYYIDNDINCNKFLNGHKENYRFLAITVSDFYKKDFVSILI